MLFGLLGQEGEEFGLASFYISERRQVRATDAGSCLSYHAGHSYTFRKLLIGADSLDSPADWISSRYFLGEPSIVILLRRYRLSTRASMVLGKKDEEAGEVNWK